MIKAVFFSLLNKQANYFLTWGPKLALQKIIQTKSLLICFRISSVELMRIIRRFNKEILDMFVQRC